MQKKVVFLVLLFLSANILYAQEQGQMQTISIPEGLSSPNVNLVYQDRFGYIWIMTEDGLNRYDGNKIKVYRNDPEDPTSLFGNRVYSAVEDKNGFLWIGGENVANRYDYASESFEAYTFDSGGNTDKVISIFMDSKGRIWGGTTGGTVHRFDPEIGEFKVVYHAEHLEANYNGEIWSITELKNGKILYANRQQGIFQYDESLGKFSKYYLDNYYSPTKILGIQEDDDGTIWFSGEDIIIHYNPNLYSYEILEEFQIIPKMYHIGYHKVSTDDYIFITEPFGMIRYNPKTSKITETIETPLAPYTFISDKFGIIWIAARGGIIKYDPNREPFNHVRLTTKNTQDNRSNEIVNILPDHTDKEIVWLLASDNSIIEYNLKNSSKKSYPLSLPSPFKNNRLNNFIADKDGNFYFSMQNSQGLLKCNISNSNVSKLEYMPSTFISGFRGEGFAIDQTNNLFSASNHGVVYSNLNNKKEIVLPTYANRQYSTQIIKEIKKAVLSAEELAMITKADETKIYSLDFELEKESFVLVRCMGEGALDRLDQQLFDYGTLSSADGSIIFSMQDYGKTFHAGGAIKNRLEYAPLKLKKGKYNLKYTLDGGHSYPIFNAPMPVDSSLYGIQIYQITQGTYTTLKKQITSELNDPSVLPIEGVDEIEISRKYGNSIYLSSFSQGVVRYNLLDKSFTQFTCGNIEDTNLKNVVNHCYEDITGNLWISSAHGLILQNPENGKWRVFTEKDGLPSNNIIRTIEDKNGNLWIISLGGLSRFNKNDSSEDWNFINYDTRDGLTGYSFNGDPLLTPDGEILFIVGDVIHRFTPGKSNPVSPDIIINDFKIADVSVFKSDSPFKLKNSLTEIGEINLPYNMNDLSFNFNVIHYSRPYKNRVFYKLEGFNENWIEPELNSATFTNLEPGNYNFKVRGLSADGLESKNEASIKIKINPPWWRTTEAYLSYAFLFVGLIFGVDRIQRRRILTKERNATAIREAELRAKFAETENARKTEELEEARQLQLSMLPKDLPKLPHLDIAVYMKTATEVGGDYYDFHIGLDGTLTVVLGDATGHGMKAGTMVTTTKSLFNVLAPNPNIIETFHEMTRCLKLMQMDKLSMCLTMLKITGNNIQMSAAGMPPVFIYKKENQSIEEHVMKGMPLGTFNDFPYTIIESDISSGDTILLMSDGFPELFNENKEMYGYKRARNYFEEIAGETPEEIISKLKDAGSDWVKDADPDDDVTFVVIKVK